MENTQPQLVDSILQSFCPINSGAHSEYLARGSAADIWKITQRDHEACRLYVMKILRISPRNFDKLVGVATNEDNTRSENGTISWVEFTERYKAKISQWTSLSHANLVQVFSLQENLNLRVEFCYYGSVRDCFKTGVGEELDKGNIVSDLLAGLEYLHNEERAIVHGSLNAGKLFVDASGRIKIGEFGLTALCHDIAPMAPSVVFGGFSRWMSPELFEPTTDNASPSPSFASDIWALGCTIYEIISEKLPYGNYKHDVRVQKAIMKGEFPGDRPASFGEIYELEFWSTIEHCWSANPSQRPPAVAILKQLPIARRVLGCDEFTTWLKLADLAATYEEQGRLQVAESLRVKVQATHRRMLGDEHPSTLDSLVALAMTYKKQERFEETEALLLDVLAIRRRILGEDHLVTLATVSALAVMYHERGQLAKSETLLIQLLAAQKRVLGEKHPDTLTSMVDLAVMYHEQGRLGDTEALLLDVIPSQREALGEEDTSVLWSEGILATTYAMQGRLEEAEVLETKILAIRQRVLGVDHPETLASMANLALVYHKQGRLVEAESLRDTVLAAQRRILGHEHPDTLQSMANLAVTYHEQGRLADAEKTQLEVVAIEKRVLGEDHPQTLWSIANLAATYQNMGWLAKAEELWRQVVVVRLRVLGKSHPDTLQSIHKLAWNYQVQGRNADYERFMAENGIAASELSTEAPTSMTTGRDMNRLHFGPQYTPTSPARDVPWLEQLHERAIRLGFQLSWEQRFERHDGVVIHTATPLIDGRPYPNCAASSTTKQGAKNKSAELLMKSSTLRLETIVKVADGRISSGTYVRVPSPAADIAQPLPAGFDRTSTPRTPSDYYPHPTYRRGMTITAGMEVPKLIALFGATGTGKTMFVNNASGSHFEVGDELESCTQEVTRSEVFQVDGQEVILFDTPGFDDTELSDTEILRRITAFLTSTYQKGYKLTGVIYLHRITDNRMSGISRRTFRILRELCGQDTLSNVLIVTNMWSNPPTKRQIQNEKQMEENYFQPAIQAGARMARRPHMDTKSAHDIIRLLLDKQPVAMKIQRQIVDDGEGFFATDAAMVLGEELAKAEQRYLNEIEEVREELRKAKEENDTQSQSELREHFDRLSAESARLAGEIQSLRQGFDEERLRWERRVDAAEQDRREAERQQREMAYQLEELRQRFEEASGEERRMWERAISELRAKIVELTTQRGGCIIM